MKQVLLTCLTVVTLGCATAPATGAGAAPVSAADRDAVIAAVNSLFTAMRTRDTTAIRALLIPNTQLVSVRTVPGSPPHVQAQPLSAFVTAIGGEPEELVERMWDPRVEIAGDMASLWAPYDFRIGARFNHCGHDAVHLVRTPTGWKISGITYTVITTGCSVP